MNAIIEGLEERNPNKFGGMVSRKATVKGKDFEKGIDTIATTDAPVLVLDWERWDVVREILPMEFMEMPNNDKVPLLDSHMRNGVDNIKGSATNWRIEGGNLMAKTFISDTETAIKQKIQEGHIDSVSIGYATDAEQTAEVPKGKSIKINGKEFKNDFTDGIAMVVRTWWKPHELSLVPIGADDAAKFKSIASVEDKGLIEKINDLAKRIDEVIEKKQEPSSEADLFKLKHSIYKLKQI